MIDCNIEYRDSKNSFLGFDSDGTFNDLKPNESCLVSIPLVVPDNTVKKTLTVEGEMTKSLASKYGTWIVLTGFLIILLIDRFSA